MISQCSNSECRKPLTYLNNGRVIRTVKHTGFAPVIQHYWLCGECYLHHDFSISAADIVSCVSREMPIPMPEDQLGPGFAP
jgi:hypothetical protein